MTRIVRCVVLQISLVMLVKTASGKSVDEIIEKRIEFNGTMKINTKEYPITLKSPAIYKLEDLLISLSILLGLFFIFTIWYFLTRLIIHLVYHKMKRSKSFNDGDEESV